MTELAKRRATYEDLCQVPDSKLAQIINGELIVLPRPAPGHALATSALGGELSNPFHRGRGGPGGWWILDEPELHLGLDILVPNLAGWRRDRMPVLPRTAYFELPPDWVCEVLSPSTARMDQADKLPIYARHGVRYAWVIDPETRLLEALRLDSEGQWQCLATIRDDEEVCVSPFDAVTFGLGALWS